MQLGLIIDFCQKVFGLGKAHPILRGCLEALQRGPVLRKGCLEALQRGSEAMQRGSCIL